MGLAMGCSWTWRSIRAIDWVVDAVAVWSDWREGTGLDGCVMPELGDMGSFVVDLARCASRPAGIEWSEGGQSSQHDTDPGSLASDIGSIILKSPRKRDNTASENHTHPKLFQCSFWIRISGTFSDLKGSM